MTTTLRNGSIGVFLGALACTCAWAGSDGWTRIGFEFSVDAASPELQREVHEWLAARAAPEPASLGALYVDVTRVFPGQSLPSAEAALESSPGTFPPATMDGSRVRILSCSSDVRTEWTWRAKDGQWNLQRYDTRHATASDVPCDAMPPLPEARS